MLKYANIREEELEYHKTLYRKYPEEPNEKSTKKEFIEGLANIVRNALKSEKGLAKCGIGDGSRYCPNQFGVCGHGVLG